MSTKEAIVIGINHYAVGPSLRFATSDANEFASALEMPEYNFDTKRLLDTEATTSNITEGITELLSGSAQTKVIFFAGHGFADDNGAYLATADDSVDVPGVSLDWVREQISTAKDTVILILDCCYSGAANVRNRVKLRSVSDVDLDRAFGTLGSGKFLLAACPPDQTTIESSELGHGIFTFYLLEGMIGPAFNIRGTITPIGLFDYVATKCEEEGHRKPVFKGEQAGAVVLGSGASPLPGLDLRPQVEGGKEVDDDVARQLEQCATAHLNRYLAQASVPYEQWITEGYSSAARSLEQIMRWFERTVSETPAMMARSVFARAYSEARARRAQLGNVSQGTHTDQGQIAERLGSGAFGTVWKIEKPDGGKLAYKIYHPNDIEVREKVARFQRGYRAMRLLEHPHIVKVHGDTQCPLGFYMDLVEGPNLRDFIGYNLEITEVLELLIKIAETLQHAHGRNVIHRDVKPENIVLQYDTEIATWIPYLTDFDLAWFSTATQLTKEGFGAIYYASPEQLSKPSSRVAHAATTDVYSFGQLAFFVAAGSDPAPFNGADNRSVLRDRLGGWPVAQAANIFGDLYENCTQYDPSKRWAGFRTIIDALFEALTLIRQSDVDQPIEEERFVTELVYALAGLFDHQREGYEPFNSLSGRTQITITSASAGGNGLDLTLSMEQGLTVISGANAETSRRILNTSLDRALQGYTNVMRRHGTQGNYQVFLDVKNMPINLRGVHNCRSIISRAIDAIESP